MQQPIEQPLTYDELAKLLGISTDTLRRMVDEGDWPAPMLLGKQLRWRPEAIRRFMDASELVQSVKRQAGNLPQSDRVLPNSDANERNEDLGTSTPKPRR